MHTINYYEKVKEKPEIFTQLKCKDLLFVHYKCPAVDRLIGKWSQHNYILHVVTGKLAYHTPQRSWLLSSGSAVFIKKGAGIMEKFFDETLCIMTFFIPDSYLCSFISDNQIRLQKPSTEPNPELIIPLEVTEMMQAYFNSITPYFHSESVPSEDLLELKFRELLFNVVTNPTNKDMICYLQTLLVPKIDQLQQIMEANCLFNLSLQDYAKLCNRSLSSFKRDFQSVYKTNPGHWLLNKKLSYSSYLLVATDKNINEICYESGFEDSAHFSKAFKKHFGKSPLYYRKEKSTRTGALGVV